MPKDHDQPLTAAVRRRRLPAVILAVFLACGALVVAPQPASATHYPGHVNCWGDWCSGQDPAAMGCDADAYTVVHARIPGTWSNVELRWSPTCKTNWARVPSGHGQYYPWALRAVQRPTGYSQVGVVRSNTYYSWTRMIYSPTMCVYAAWTGPPGTVGTSCA